MEFYSLYSSEILLREQVKDDVVGGVFTSSSHERCCQYKGLA
jgi:hypothetical protein